MVPFQVDHRFFLVLVFQACSVCYKYALDSQIYIYITPLQGFSFFNFWTRGVSRISGTV